MLHIILRVVKYLGMTSICTFSSDSKKHLAIGESILGPSLGFEDGQQTHIQGTNWWAEERLCEPGQHWHYSSQPPHMDLRAALLDGYGGTYKTRSQRLIYIYMYQTELQLFGTIIQIFQDRSKTTNTNQDKTYQIR